MVRHKISSGDEDLKLYLSDVWNHQLVGITLMFTLSWMVVHTSFQSMIQVDASQIIF